MPKKKMFPLKKYGLEPCISFFFLSKNPSFSGRKFLIVAAKSSWRCRGQRSCALFCHPPPLPNPLLHPSGKDFKVNSTTEYYKVPYQVPYVFPYLMPMTSSTWRGLSTLSRCSVGGRVSRPGKPVPPIDPLGSSDHGYLHTCFSWAHRQFSFWFCPYA